MNQSPTFPVRCHEKHGTSLAHSAGLNPTSPNLGTCRNHWLRRWHASLWEPAAMRRGLSGVVWGHSSYA